MFHLLRKHYFTIQREHDALNKIMSQLQAILRKKSFSLLQNYFAKYLRSLDTILVDHFTMEETILFPSLIGARSDLLLVDDVLALQKEHGNILASLDFVKRLLAERDLTDNSVQLIIYYETINMVRFYFDHIQKEELFFKELQDKRSDEKGA